MHIPQFNTQIKSLWWANASYLTRMGLLFRMLQVMSPIIRLALKLEATFTTDVSNRSHVKNKAQPPNLDKTSKMSNVRDVVPYIHNILAPFKPDSHRVRNKLQPFFVLNDV
jgi:hypothetical protein